MGNDDEAGRESRSGLLYPLPVSGGFPTGHFRCLPMFAMSPRFLTAGMYDCQLPVSPPGTNGLYLPRSGQETFDAVVLLP
jgi:hypothetical protein